MFDYEKEYSDFKNHLYEICTSQEERKRIDEEFELFERRGWQKYIVILSKIITGLEKDDVLQFDLARTCHEGGSSYDSYVLRKFRGENADVLRNLLTDNRSRGYLFNDALRLMFSIHSFDKNMNIKSIQHLDAILDPIVKESGLHYAQNLKSGPYPWAKECNVELLVLSESKIPEEDFELIVNETRRSTPEEADRLRKYLIVKFSVVWH